MSDDVPKYVIEGGWLAIEHGVHDCAGGTPEASGMHEPTCGMSPVMRLEDLHAVLAKPWEPDRYWRVLYATPHITPDGGPAVYCETSNGQQARDALARCPGGGVLQRLWERHDQEWREELPGEPVCRCRHGWGAHSDIDGKCARCTCGQYEGPYPPSGEPVA